MGEGNAVEEHVELSLSLCHLLFVCRDNVVGGTQLEGRLPLLVGAAEDGDVRAHGLANLNCHVTQSTQANHAQPLA